jgi:hypothetical protein
MKKTFDCVRMKHEIQQKLLERMRDMTPEEQRRFTEDIILSNPKLARFWKRRCSTTDGAGRTDGR